MSISQYTKVTIRNRANYQNQSKQTGHTSGVKVGGVQVRKRKERAETNFNMKHGKKYTQELTTS